VLSVVVTHVGLPRLFRHLVCAADANHLGLFAIDLLEALVGQFRGQAVKDQLAILEANDARGVAMDQVQEVQAAQDGDAGG